MRIFLMLLLVVSLGCSSTSSIMPTSDSATKVVQKSTFAQGQIFQLADPILNLDDGLFKESTKATLALHYPDTKIFYTLDNNEPTSSSQLYDSAIQITQSGTLKAKAFHPNHLPSNTVAVSFLKIENPISTKSIEVNATPHENYQGQGTKTLFDQKKGSLNFRTSEWLGFKGEDVEINMTLESEHPIRQLVVSTLSDVGSWIFPPAAIEIWAINNGQGDTLIAKKEFLKLEKATIPSLKYLTLDFPTKTLKGLKIIVRNNGLIPDWHDGKGTPAWLFLDEIILQ